MPRFCLLLSLAVVCLIPALSQKANPFAGRWDIEVSPTGNASPYPDWMELEGTTMRIQPRGGSVFTVTDFQVSGSHLTVTWPHSDAKAPVITKDTATTENRVSGAERLGGNIVAYLSGSRAPALARKMPA